MDVERGAARRITNTAFSEVSPSWSADDEWIYYGSNVAGDWQIWRHRIEDETTNQVTTHGGLVALEAPAGGELYFLKRGDKGIWRHHLASGIEECVVDDVLPHDNLNWAVTNRGLYFIRGNKLTDRSLVMLDFAAGQERLLLEELKPSFYPGLSVSPDGASVLLVQMDDFASDIMLAESVSEDSCPLLAGAE